jgi:hypothetical protein
MSASPSFEKVAECLYRNPSSQQYYALLKIRGKQIRRSLKTANLQEAKRKLLAFKTDQAKIDPLAGKTTVAALCDLQLEIIKGQAPKTVRRKSDVSKLVRRKWGHMDASRVAARCFLVGRPFNGNRTIVSRSGLASEDDPPGAPSDLF